MIQFKSAELLFLIGVVMCCVASDFVDYFSTNNKTFLVNGSVDDIIESSSNHFNDDDRYTFSTKSLPNDSKLLPTLGNGHLGFTVLTDAVYMNGLYSGHHGLSHRARIPNFVNILLADCLKQTCKYSLNVKLGYFMVELVVENQFIARHLLYAHRFYNRALINQIHIQRLGSRDDIALKLQRNPGRDGAPTKAKIVRRQRKESHNNFHNNEPESVDNENLRSTPYNADEKDDLNFTKNETIDFDGARLYLVCGRIKELENGGKEQSGEFNEEKQQQNRQREEATEEEPTRQEEDVCVVWNHVPEEITLNRTASSISYKFVMAVDTQAVDVRQEMIDVLRITDDELFASHIKEWQAFWSNLQIEADGDDELFRAIISSIFYLTSSLPSMQSNLPQHPFYGLSPTGLGRGGSDLSDYEGHNFWDTEIFMLPPVALLNPTWARELLHYRFTMLNAAKDYANAGGYSGARFPWESAATGIEVIQPGYEYIAKYQLHITGDISFALRQYLSLTHDVDFMKSEGCEMALEIAKFWESRVTFNRSSGFYDINRVMGPDEDHEDVNNNVYTNVVAKLALNFGSFAECLCGGNKSAEKWSEIAEKMKILFDPVLDYHPQYDDFAVGTEIKQADTVLVGYPLMFPMNRSTRINDLKVYGNATRSSGPAMSFSMYTINYLDIDDEVNANEMLEKSFKPHIRQPFNVWSEVVEGETGATNFVTGAGGFLQTIFNGFLGIRVHPTHLEIRKPKRPKNCTKLDVKGFSYLKSKFQLQISIHGIHLNFVVLKDDLNLTTADGKEVLIEENVSYDITTSSTSTVKPSTNPFGICSLIL